MLRATAKHNSSDQIPNHSSPIVIPMTRSSFKLVDAPAGIISSLSRSTTLVDALGPPEEQRRGADELGLVLEGSTAGELHVFQLVDDGKMLVDQCDIRQRPEVLGRLQLRRVRRQEEQMDMIWHA